MTDLYSKLSTLKRCYDEGLVSHDEYIRARANVLADWVGGKVKSNILIKTYFFHLTFN
ncbi:hypothetical protein C2G38_2100848, partial [Gigaspora rosea]